MEWKKEIYLVITGYSIKHTLIQEYMKTYAFYRNDFTKKPIRVHEDDAIFPTRLNALKFIRSIGKDTVKYCNSEIKTEEEKERVD